MKLVTKYFKPYNPEFQLHKFKTANGSIRYYQIDGWVKNPSKFAVRKSSADYWISENIYVTREDLNKSQLKDLELTEKILEGELS